MLDAYLETDGQKTCSLRPTDRNSVVHVLRAKEVRVLEVCAAELVWVHAERCMVHRLGKHQLGVWIERAACGALIPVKKTVSRRRVA